jgi:hypothetical protein
LKKNLNQREGYTQKLNQDASRLLFYFLLLQSVSIVKSADASKSILKQKLPEIYLDNVVLKS